MNCGAVLAFSMHLLAGDWNEVHPGVHCDASGWIGGAYYNSESEISLFVGRDFGNVEIGLVTGYTAAPVVPMVRVTYDVNDHLTLFASPAATVDGDLGVVLGTQINF